MSNLKKFLSNFSTIINLNCDNLGSPSLWNSLLLMRGNEKFHRLRKRAMIREAEGKKGMWAQRSFFHSTFASLVPRYNFLAKKAPFDGIKGRYVWKSLMIWKMYDNLYDMKGREGFSSARRTFNVPWIYRENFFSLAHAKNIAQVERAKWRIKCDAKDDDDMFCEREKKNSLTVGVHREMKYVLL